MGLIKLLPFNFFAFFHFFPVASPAQTAATVYPRIAGYVGIVHPIANFSSEGSTYNIKDYYLVGMPTGINIWKSTSTGFSFEVVPFIRSEKGSSKMSNFLFHPGILLNMGKGFTFAGRAAFETSGRYGFTPVFNKVVKKNKQTGYFIAVPLATRFGNNHPASFSPGFQFGISF